MLLVQILLPTYDNSGKRFPIVYHQEVKAELAHRFEGLTAYNRAPAEGLWKRGSSTKYEDIVIYEIMVSKVNARWWRTYRSRLERRFQQEHVVVRAYKILML